MTMATVEAPAKLNTTDAAEYLGLAVSTLETWRSKGTGPHFIKCGAKVWYLVADLDAYMQGRRVQSTAQLED